MQDLKITLPDTSSALTSVRVAPKFRLFFQLSWKLSWELRGFV